MRPEGRKQRLELDLNKTMADYEEETGLTIVGFVFNRYLRSEVSKTYVPQIKVEVRVPD